jgi:hypothetical protein
MPRPLHAIPKKQVLVLLPPSLDKAMRDMLFDDTKGRVPGGAISAYIEALIKKDLARFANLNLEELAGESHE